MVMLIGFWEETIIVIIIDYLQAVIATTLLPVVQIVHWGSNYTVDIWTTKLKVTYPIRTHSTLKKFSRVLAPPACVHTMASPLSSATTLG